MVLVNIVYFLFSHVKWWLSIVI
uniref:Uncharacterized protein n=1 Tax=Arundo donax TaxID=35708 RepID=A0A0A8Y5U7_ARUDO